MQLATLYGGDIEYLFVVEDDDDPACSAITSLTEELAVSGVLVFVSRFACLADLELSGNWKKPLALVFLKADTLETLSFVGVGVSGVHAHRI
jgi:hypothetical protein